MKALAFLIVFILFILLPSVCNAVTVSITSSPASITQDGFDVSVSILGASPGTNYVRVDLYKDGTSNFFGETNNGSDWYSGSEGKQYFPITIIDSKSTASATFQARTGSPNSTDYVGSGSYKMRIRRYTSSGGPGSEDPNASSVAINISIPIPTSTPLPTFTPVPSPTTKPSATPTPTPIPSKTPTPKPSSQQLTSLTPPPPSPTDSSQSVLGTTASDINPTKSSQKQIHVAAISSENFVGKLFITLGGIFLIHCGIVLAWSYKKSHELKP